MLTIDQMLNLNWKKVNGLIPVIAQDFVSNEILMHGYMNKKALLKTFNSKHLTFFSRTKNRLWTKGETSKNYLKVIDIIEDCDRDSLLALVKPVGHTCHLQRKSCFNIVSTNFSFILQLEKILENRKKKINSKSYTYSLYKKGVNRIAQKVGEEAVELVISSICKNKQDIINESSDLFYHLLVLLHDQNLEFSDIISVLKKRNSL
ncbi:bifunctional phosphoribosyl-AMP cyclohydrolase/phosphoribosyl-ATP diphosphatase HisIE [Buchnera aphidicola]|uniref:bifunctional phosphoribosyl-AMP cyclohydrolase/phosphoribosyl-ATP diphosphatase HisIE n=1 Tax=Buchnera aphidicola TaxID=9 RepID=UPI002091EBCB|nr:bifunctional phosphoribosyl-AMP cyclohydrolase/phosphoribosyl-ATP diphosphatase HisIE [Buchnera aphidicola]USS94207.1 bifunctional phosphoribosyl-AMP cyclohydrolase/phosphoribosyl-ATP diphosphatase HisIE [Buchnera aphidicola (Sipha maydis)]WII23755.1 bifunctional phosphoribosyl-AMP cyclohydrolase/phosphoribosyl-ATP diphosphatase HisIE [Buchnera aphidicola (Sipha maydis)]